MKFLLTGITIILSLFVLNTYSLNLEAQATEMSPECQKVKRMAERKVNSGRDNTFGIDRHYREISDLATYYIAFCNE